ncbi:hypothetical protein BO71DRAFT_488612 [Aspergillus ellipticus CBS 707.79]|uniref:Uncharacterized protein n=1 Tax=Aspergillus ellipticus CBS 707.79 TaxID=1448320 RepID=A0A319CTI8_9EURO|nr:hypothetical protein BO71DRAFT_488612 [Aspergillus ellipticus CBS 707.79]
MNLLFSTIAALVATANAFTALQPPDENLPPQAGIEINLSQPYTLTWSHASKSETGNLCIDIVTRVNFCVESARIVKTPIANNQYLLTLSDIQSHPLIAQTQYGCPNQPPQRPIDKGVYELYYNPCTADQPDSQWAHSQDFQLTW